MIDPKAITEIIATYQKYGWVLRRVLLTTELKNKLGADTAKIFGDTQVWDADIDAAWFSRPPQPGGVAWEIRHLSENPYALLENIDEESEGFEAALGSVESRLRESVSRVRSA